MANYQEIYEHHAAEYDELVTREDHEGHLPALLERLLSPRPRVIVELGCGTGRVTRLLTPKADKVLAFDGAAPMIAFAKSSFRAPNLTYGVADNGSTPVDDGAADAVVAGWTLGHFTGFYPDTWRLHALRALGEMRRCAAPHGKFIIIETLGTCVDAPAPPNPRLAEFYALLEDGFGLTRHEITTDYAFESVAEAAKNMGFFFGPKMKDEVEKRGARIVPEWTGVWVGAARTQG